eukprot:5579131-Alexandrium_andersonii.AAC.1
MFGRPARGGQMELPCSLLQEDLYHSHHTVEPSTVAASVHCRGGMESETTHAGQTEAQCWMMVQWSEPAAGHRP